MYIIGIDIGTTSICGIKINAKTGKVIKSKTVNSDAFIKSEYSFEKAQSPEKIIKIATEILDSLCCRNVKSIGITGQMHGILYVDSNGFCVSPLYTWQDERGNEPYKNTTYAEYLGSFSGYGNVTDFYNKINNIRPESAVSYCTIHDYFAMTLCGLTKPIIHTSNAASFGLFDLKSKKFSYEVNAEIVDDYCVVGKYNNIPVGVAIGDNQASVFSTLSCNDDLLVNFGTGSQISVVSDNIVEKDNIETRPYFENKYLIVGSALCGGRAYSILKSFYLEILKYANITDDEKVYSIMSKMLSASPTTDLIVDTRFSGTRSNPEKKGSISDISTKNFTPNDLTRGVLNGMVEELHTMYSQMNIKKNGIVGSGNGIRKNKNLMQIVEEQFEGKIKIPTHLEEAAFGSALFAAVCAGIFKNAKEAQSLIKYD